MERNNTMAESVSHVDHLDAIEQDFQETREGKKGGDGCNEEHVTISNPLRKTELAAISATESLCQQDDYDMGF